jgi:hypothetical protein
MDPEGTAAVTPPEPTILAMAAILFAVPAYSE